MRAPRAAAPERQEDQTPANSPKRANRIVPVGTMGEAISLRVQNLQAQARKVVGQIETSRSPDPIMRRPCADREEKRGPAGATYPGQKVRSSLTSTDPNQRGLSETRLLSFNPGNYPRRWLMIA